MGFPSFTREPGGGCIPAKCHGKNLIVCEISWLPYSILVETTKRYGGAFCEREVNRRNQFRSFSHSFGQRASTTTSSNRANKRYQLQTGAENLREPELLHGVLLPFVTSPKVPPIYPHIDSDR